MIFFKYWCLLVLQLSPIFAATFKDSCRPSSEVIAELENRYEIRFDRPAVNFTYDASNVYVKKFNYSNTELKLLTANVIFFGSIESKGKVKSNGSSINFYTKLITVHRTEKPASSEINRNCMMTFSDNYDLGFSLPTEMEGGLIQLTELCLQTHLCQRFDVIVAYDFLHKHEGENETDFIENLPPATNPPATTRSIINKETIAVNSTYNPQATINAMTDFAVRILIHNFATDSDGIVCIPEIYQNFSTGRSFWITTGEVTTSNGTFKDLKTLERISDVVFENSDLQFSVSSTYRLAKAEIKFPYYKVRYGKIKIDGKISGQIDGITLGAKISVDFNSRPCRILLDNFSLEQLGNINIEMTGLGILNSQVSNLISYAIRNKTFEHVKKAIEESLYSLDCERYRPKIRSIN